MISGLRVGDCVKAMLMGPHPLYPFFNPRSIAVFGASASETTLGGRVFANLVAGDFDGLLVAINPEHEEILGRRCFARI